MSRWFRHYAGMMRDDKLVSVALRCRQPIERVVWVWGAILESASEIDDNGRFDVDPAEIAYFLRADEADILALVAGLESAGRIASGVVVKWGDRQFQSDRSAARQAAYRERKRAENRGSDDNETSANGEVTSPSRHGDAPETETESKTEKKSSGANAPSPRAWSLPAGVSLLIWTDFMSNRRRKRAGNTESAWKKFNDDLARVSAQTGIPPPKLIEHAAASGWAGIYDPTEGRNGRNGIHPLAGNQPGEGLGRTARAAIRAFGPVAGPEDRAEAGQH